MSSNICYVPIGLASKLLQSLEQIWSHLVTKSSHISDTHGGFTQVVILDQGRPKRHSLVDLRSRRHIWKLWYPSVVRTNIDPVPYALVAALLASFSFMPQHGNLPTIHSVLTRWQISHLITSKDLFKLSLFDKIKIHQSSMGMTHQSSTIRSPWGWALCSTILFAGFK